MKQSEYIVILGADIILAQHHQFRFYSIGGSSITRCWCRRCGLAIDRGGYSSYYESLKRRDHLIGYLFRTCQPMIFKSNIPF